MRFFSTILLASMLGILSYQAQSAVSRASCIDLPHTDGATRNICDKNGKSFLIFEFFSPGCGPCQRNVAYFKKLEEETASFAHSRLITSANLALAQQFVRRNNLSSDVAIDSAQQARRDFNVRGVPTVIVIDEKNEVIYQRLGLLNDVEINKIRDLVGLAR